jgi:hypothetical protein
VLDMGILQRRKAIKAQSQRRRKAHNLFALMRKRISKKVCDANESRDVLINEGLDVSVYR